MGDDGRIERALRQRMFLVAATPIPGDVGWRLSVEGSQGVVYKVVLRSRECSCTCPDFLRRGRPCKHILFVLARVAKCRSEACAIPPSPRAFRLTPGLAEALRRALVFHVESHRAADAPPPPPSAAEPTGPEDAGVDGDCAICFEGLAGGGALARCESSCGNRFHLECITRWVARTPTCPLCRANFPLPRRAAGWDEAGAGDDCMSKYVPIERGWRDGGDERDWDGDDGVPALQILAASGQWIDLD